MSPAQFSLAYKNFEEWNPDENIHKAAAALYKDIDRLELHVGLQAEEAKKPQPGAGLCPGYTISRAILADAVCLTRGDRFLTTDFTRKWLSFTYSNVPVPDRMVQRTISLLGATKTANMT